MKDRKYDWNRIRSNPNLNESRKAQKRGTYMRRMTEDVEFRDKIKKSSVKSKLRLQGLPKKERKALTHKWRLSSNYGLTPEDYTEMLKSQGGVCAICKTKEPGGSRSVFAVDHCHSTGKIRGLLCSTCNLGLGKFKDDPELLFAAVGYLKAAELKPLPQDQIHTLVCSDCKNQWKSFDIKLKLCESCRSKKSLSFRQEWLSRRTKTCPVCGVFFVDETQANNRKYCSGGCLKLRR